MRNQIGVFIVALVLSAVVLAATPAGNAANGKKLYVANCQSCHGVGAAGVTGLGPVLKGEVAGWKFEFFKRAVLSGVDDVGKVLATAMPRFGKVGLTDPKGKIPTETQLRDLQAYLKTLK